MPDPIEGSEGQNAGGHVRNKDSCELLDGVWGTTEN